MVLQRPGSAHGVILITVEDETGIATLVVWAKVFEQFRRIVLYAGMIAVAGRVQREGEVVHLVAHGITDFSAELAGVACRGGTGTSSTPTNEALLVLPQARDLYISDLHIDGICVKTRDFR